MIFSRRIFSSGKAGFVWIPWGVKLNQAVTGTALFVSLCLAADRLWCGPCKLRTVLGLLCWRTELVTSTKRLWMWQPRSVHPPPVPVTGLFYGVQSSHRAGLLSESSMGLSQLAGLQLLDQNLMALSCSSSPVSGWALGWCIHSSKFLLWREGFAGKCHFFFSLSVLNTSQRLHCWFSLCSPMVTGSEPFWLLGWTAVLTPSPHPLVSREPKRL